MREALLTTARVLGILAAGLFMLVGGALLFANTDPGRRVVASLLNPLLGGDVVIEGLGGRFPDAPSAARVEIRDTQGLWLTLDHVVLKWSPLALLGNHVVASSVSADRAVVLRLPVPSGSKAETPAIDVGQARIDRIVLGRAVVGRPAILAASGHIHYVGSTQYSGVLHATRLDAPGSYDVRGAYSGNDVAGSAGIREPADGLVATAIGLPDLGSVAAYAEAAGATGGNRWRAAISAGVLRADAEGLLDLRHRRIAMSFVASSPAMSPRRDLAWQSATLKGTISGPLSTPDMTGRLAFAGLKAADGSASQLTAALQGRKGNIHLTGKLTDIRIPGSRPDVLSASPVLLEAHASFAARSLDFVLTHPLLALTGHVIADDSATRGVFGLDIAKLGPLTQAANFGMTGYGHANMILTIKPPQTVVALDGTLRVDGGTSVISTLLEPATEFTALASVQQSRVTLETLTVESAAATASARGDVQNGKSNFSWSLALRDVSRVAPTLRGSLVLQGSLTGMAGVQRVTAAGTGNISTRGIASGPLRLALNASGLPDTPQGSLDASGKLAGAPIAVATKLVRQRNGALQLSIERGSWKSLRVAGRLAANPSFHAPSGDLELHVGQLADLAPLVGHTLSGGLEARTAFVATAGKSRADVLLATHALRYDSLSAEDVKIAGNIADPFAKPVAALSYAVKNLAGYDANGTANGEVHGPFDAMAVTLDSQWHVPNGMELQLAAAAITDVTHESVALTRLTLNSAGQEAHLLAPSRFDFAHGMAVDSLRLGSGASEFDISGRFAPVLAASFRGNAVAGSIAKLFDPTVVARGSLSATGALSGSLTAPEGRLALTGKGLQVDMGAGGALPPSDISAEALLHNKDVTLNAVLHTGSKASLTVAGEAPLSTHGALGLRVAGNEDLSLLDPVLNASGLAVHGALAMNGLVTGTYASPRMNGSGALSNGEFVDYVRGIRLSGMSAQFDANGDAIAINNFLAHAGEGTLAGSGTLDLQAPGEPISLTIRAINAKPVSNNVLDAVLDANLKLSGGLARSFALSGDVNVRRADVNIPDHLPPEAQVFRIRGRGEPLPPPPPSVALDLHIRSGGNIFIRGHGLDAVVGGQVHIAGTTLGPSVSGGFDLKRGNLSFAGQTLDFTSGRVSFDGESLRNRIDPALDLVAQSSSGGTSATLTVSGHASAPKIELTSTPPLPQDEILAQLLFQQSSSQLSPWQLAQVGAALASLGNMGGLGDPLSRVRNSLGLDRLAVTSGGSTGTDTVVEAGRYVAHNIYVGAKQGAAGSTQAVVQVDVTRHLKVQTQISSNNTPTPVTPGTAPIDTGSNIGLSYQFEY